MCQLKIFTVFVLLFSILELMDAKPLHGDIRIKRTSDQRLAELETLIALSKMNGKLVTIPIGFGKVDPIKLGRRKRSVSLLLQKLFQDLSTENELSDEFLGGKSEREKKEEEDGGGEEKEDEREIEEFFNEKLRLFHRPHHLHVLPE